LLDARGPGDFSCPALPATKAADSTRPVNRIIRIPGNNHQESWTFYERVAAFTFILTWMKEGYSMDNRKRRRRTAGRAAAVAGLAMLSTRGATLAVRVKNNVGTILIGSALEEHGLSLSNVRLVPIQFPLMVAALKDHQVDAAWVPEPFLSTAEEQLGAESIYDLDQGSAQSFPVSNAMYTFGLLKQPFNVGQMTG
jgi:hypothetical protein